MRIISWNVNSLSARIVDNETSKKKKKQRIVLENSPFDQILKKDVDIICLQETKLQKEKENIFKFPEEYKVYWSSSTVKKGYSGTCILSKIEPKEVLYQLPTLDKDLEVNNEGRIIIAIYENFVLLNIYTPNTQRAGRGDVKQEKLEFIERRTSWDNALQEYMKTLELPIIWCGDLNVVRKLKDIYFGDKDRIEENISRHKRCIKDFEKGKDAGYRICERDGIESILSNVNLVDSYRYLNTAEDDYGFTYWNQIKGKSWRNQDNGLRIDYFIISRSIISKVEKVIVFKEISEGIPQSSDHAPILMQIDF